MSKMSSPMSPATSKDARSREWAGAHDHLVIPGGPEALHQPATPNAAGIRFRTGEVKPGSPGGSSKIDSPFQDVVAAKVPRSK